MQLQDKIKGGQRGQVHINIDYSSSWSGVPVFASEGEWSEDRRTSLSRARSWNGRCQMEELEKLVKPLLSKAISSAGSSQKTLLVAESSQRMTIRENVHFWRDQEVVKIEKVVKEEVVASQGSEGMRHARLVRQSKVRGESPTSPRRKESLSLELVKAQEGEPRVVQHQHSMFSMMGWSSGHRAFRSPRVPPATFSLDEVETSREQFNGRRACAVLLSVCASCVTFYLVFTFIATLP